MIYRGTTQQKWNEKEKNPFLLSSFFFFPTNAKKAAAVSGLN